LWIDDMRSQLKKTLKIHVVPGVDARAGARDFLVNGAVGIDDIAEDMYEVIWEEILEELGHAADGMAIRRQRIETRTGPVFVFRDGALWTAANARAAVLDVQGLPKGRA
jgi:hypothetical protein